MNYRRAKKGEIEALVELRLAYFAATGRGQDEEIEQVKKQLPDYFARHVEKDLFCYIAEEEGRLIGSAFLIVIEKPANLSFPHGRVGTVLNVYTDKEYRNKGIAKNLMKMLIEDGKKMGLDYVSLEATKAGYPVYKKVGFQEEKSEYISMKYDYLI
ncbi:histone acetyltransferase HPA2 and related acetyltransferases [Lachnospiraceae bacterium KM106-2]|nr:histone acetyltransferase HPA2 and related acetyltransferases [Lachnospiraceae bacterium KM106-2]